MKIFLAIFGGAALFGAVRSALAIWLPKYRGFWGGPFTGHSSKNDPDRMPCGIISHVGVSLAFAGFASAAFLSLFSDSTPRSSHVGLLPGVVLSCILIGFFLMMVGWLLDSRAQDSARRRELQRWIAVAGGAVILVTMILFLIFHL